MQKKIVNIPILGDVEVSHQLVGRDRIFTINVACDIDQGREIQEKVGFHPCGYGFYQFRANGTGRRWNCADSCD